MSQENFGPWTDFAEDMIGLEEQQKNNKTRRLTYGVSYLDDALVGIAPNDLVLIAGRSGQGKSELALHISEHNARQGKRVLHIALESEKKELTRRALFKIMSEQFYRDKYRQMTAERPRYSEWHFGLQDHLLEPYKEYAKESLFAIKKNLKFFYREEKFDIKSLVQLFVSAKGNFDLVVLDHFHYFDLEGKTNENQEQKELIKEIRDMALIYDIPIVLAAHIRKADRSSSGAIPSIEDIHGSSDIYKVATKAIIIAPGTQVKDVALDAKFRYPTYLRIGKSRQDGSLTKYCSVCIFNVSLNKYEDKYKLGLVDFNGAWVEINDVPYWAKNHKGISI